MNKLKNKLTSQLKLALAAVLALSAGVCTAQGYPNKPVRVIVPFPAGGAVDLLMRLIQPKMAEALAQPLIVENRSGAGGNLGAEAIARATPDGYTFGINTNGQAIAPAMYRKLNYDPVKDLSPLSQLTASHLLLIASPKSSIASVGELIARAKENPGALNYGNTGAGTPLDLTMELLKLSAGIEVLAVPYRGDAPLHAALAAGQVELAIVPLSSTLALVKSGKMRALAVPSAKRVGVLPDVPAIAETLPGFESTAWHGLFLPAKTPRDIADVLHRAVLRALAAPDVRERFLSMAYDVIGSTPEQFKVVFDADVAKFARIVKEARIPVQE
jgi:tripartite-type tricarboxylate transporter receptor subunit TctC